MPGPVSATRPSLADRMRALASQQPEHAAELRERADALDAAANQTDVRKLLGAWGRARLLWCSITGEALI